MFSTGGRFTAKQLLIISNKLQLLEVETHCIKPGITNFCTSANHLAEQVRNPYRNGICIDKIGKYFLLSGGNHSSSDGLFFTSIYKLALMKITTAKRWLMRAKGINDICYMLPPTLQNINIIYVIRAERRVHYQKLQIMPTP